MPPSPDQDRRLARQSRLAGLVIAVSMVMWIGGQWLGGKLGWDPRYAFLFDFAALAALFFALVVTYRIWRARQSNQG